MTLGQKQEIFSLNLGHLLLFAYTRGYRIRMGEVLRTREQALMNANNGTGITNSLHIVKLAADLNVFKDGTWLTDSANLKELGDFWKSLDPLNCWGGDFSKPDGNHFSMSHEGRK